MKNFIGRDGFIWWIGKVVDLDDPLSLGRCRVRIFGYHGEERDIPNDDLPWAVAIHPINTPNLYATPKVGYFVFGFFLDATSAQEPAMLGYFPGAPLEGERNFTNISSKEDVLLDINGAKISISNTGIVTISSTNSIQILSDSDIVFKSKDVEQITLKTIVDSLGTGTDTGTDGGSSGGDTQDLSALEDLVLDVYDATNTAIDLIDGVSDQANSAFKKANTAFILS
jgi:hypothetical protein